MEASDKTYKQTMPADKEKKIGEELPEKDNKEIDIYLFCNGQKDSPPRKYHLQTVELTKWETFLAFLARLQYGSLHTSIELHELDGCKVQGPSEIRDGAAYVAVIPPDAFINTGYDKYLMKASRSFEKRAAKRNSNTESASTDIQLQETSLKYSFNYPQADQDKMPVIIKDLPEVRIQNPKNPSVPTFLQKPVLKVGNTKLTDTKLKPVANQVSQRPNNVRRKSPNSGEMVINKMTLHQRINPKQNKPETLGSNTTNLESILKPKPAKLESILKPKTTAKLESYNRVVAQLDDKFSHFPKSNATQLQIDSKAQSYAANKSRTKKIVEILPPIIQGKENHTIAFMLDDQPTMPDVNNHEVTTSVQRMNDEEGMINTTSTPGLAEQSNPKDVSENKAPELSESSVNEKAKKGNQTLELSINKTGNESSRKSSFLQQEDKERFTLNTENNIVKINTETRSEKAMPFPEYISINNLNVADGNNSNKESKNIEEIMIPMPIPKPSKIYQLTHKNKEEETGRTSSTRPESIIELEDENNKNKEFQDLNAKTTSISSKSEILLKNKDINKENKNKNTYISPFNFEISLNVNADRAQGEEHSKDSLIKSSYINSINYDHESIGNTVKAQEANEGDAEKNMNSVVKNPLQNINDDGDNSDRDHFLSLIKNGNIVNLNLSLEVESAEVVLKSTQNRDLRKTNSVALEKENTGKAPNELMWSKSLQSAENDVLTHDCCRKNQKVYVYQCPCCGVNTNGAVAANNCLSPRAMDIQGFVLLPIISQPYHKSVEQSTSCCSKKRHVEVQTTESLVKLQTTDSILSSIVKENVITFPSGESCCRISDTTQSEKVIEKLASCTRCQLYIEECMVMKMNPSVPSSLNSSKKLTYSCTCCSRNQETTSTQTDWCDVLMQVRVEPNGQYTLYLPPLSLLQEYKLT